MKELLHAADSVELKKMFQTMNRENSPYIYIPITAEDGLDTDERLEKLIQGYAKAGYAGVIPFTYNKSTVEALTREYYSIYEKIRKYAAEHKMQTGYIDDSYIMRTYLSKEGNDTAICYILCLYESSCMAGDSMHKKLSDKGSLMSVMAINDDTQELLDLRPYVKDGYLDWTVPDGNWNIEQYVCQPDPDSHVINLLDYDVCFRYLKDTFRFWLDSFPKDIRDTAGPFIYRNVVFGGSNRRMWSADFNKVFEEKYGFDPAPYYPLLFRDFGPNSRRYKSLLSSCRAIMLQDGYLKAAADICHSAQIFCTGFPAESKETACSWMFGDGQMLHKYSSAPGVSIPFAYLYGLNGIKVASGAADGLGKEIVSADIFKYYLELNKDIIYRETLNSMVRGVNMLFTHLGEDRTDTNSKFGDNIKDASWGSIFSKNNDLADYAGFVTRAQSLLRGGEHISEVAIIYPIHSLHAQVYLYQSPVEGFEYPNTPENADYMELMNNFLNYVGVDATFLHPNVIRDRAFADNGILYIKDNQNEVKQKYKVLVMPSMTIVSLRTMRMIRKFFDEGGKIIATDILPSGAYECSTQFSDLNTALKSVSAEDEEITEHIRYVFGDDCLDKTKYARYYKNTNENGGTAYYFPANKRTVDGTESVSANILYQAIEKFDLAPDVFLDGMPRVEFSGIVNYHLPAFLKVKIGPRLAKGCSMNYLHKRYAGCDIYFISNTTGETYNKSILIKGRHQPEEWNPFTGKIKKLTGELVRFRGEIYTKLHTDIEPSSGTFIVSPIARSQKEILRDIIDESDIPEFFPKQNF